MQLDGTESAGRFPWRRVVLLALRVLLAVALALLWAVILQSPSDSVNAAMAGYDGRHSQLQQLDMTVRDMQARQRAVAVSADAQALAPAQAAFDAAAQLAQQRLRALGTLPCDRKGGAGATFMPVDQAQAQVEAWRGLLRAMTPGDAAAPQLAEGDALAAQLQDSVRELDREARACLRGQLDDSIAQDNEYQVQAMLLLGAITLIVVVSLVIRRNYRQQLRDQLRFSEQLINAIPLPLALRSPQGRFIRVNNAFEERNVMPRARTIGHTVAELFPRETAEKIAAMDARALASREPIDEEFDTMTDQGERHVLVRLQALRQEDDTVTGLLGIVTDVTSLRTKESELRDSNAKLKQVSLQMIEAQEDERRRVARDLHDQVGQILTALKLQLASLARRERIDQPDAALIVPIELVDEILRHTRDLSASLHPHLLDDLGLEAALNWLIDRFIRPAVPLIELRCRLEPQRGPEAIELVAFRVIQEALTNVARHAQATRVGVILEAADGTLSVEVIDDGVGFKAGNTWFDMQGATSLGVSSMSDRVAEVGGDLHVDSTPGVGTSLRVRLPWSAN